MKLADFAGPIKGRLVKSIVVNMKKRYFRTWAKEVRALIPPSEKSSSSLWRQFLVETQDLWWAHAEMLQEKPLDELRTIAAKEVRLAKECGQVINMKDHKKDISMER